MRFFVLVGLSGCVTLDSFVHNPIHCSTVSTATCEDQDEVWDRACLSCEEPYDWSKSFAWMEGTLEDGDVIRSPDAASVVNARIPTEDGLGELDLYYIPSHGGVAERAQTTVVYSNGNYAGIEHYQPRGHMLYEMGFNVVMWDYRGYGKSEPPSAPTPEQFMADAQLVRATAEEYAPDSDRIIVYAFSLGGIPAVEMAANAPACALVLEAAFTSLGHIITANSATGLPASFLSEGEFETDHKISAFSGPVFGMLGSIDRKFSVADVQDVLDAAPGPTDLWVLDGVDHGIASRGVPEAGFRAYEDRLVQFLQDHAPDCLSTATP